MKPWIVIKLLERYKEGEKEEPSTGIWEQTVLWVYQGLKGRKSFSRGEGEVPKPGAENEGCSQDSGPAGARACEQHPSEETAQQGLP